MAKATEDTAAEVAAAGAGGGAEVPNAPFRRFARATECGIPHSRFYHNESSAKGCHCADDGRGGRR